ncbi:uncharacterized protein LOC129229968 [Uloborus diversus]|uniref:uncharacterized protein LOC129229968 n=1 Tax=Uloborus diversus TaxID=327109 RepID=UPI0024090687|nr:uncharacterized protein LOC129229968 [Uloborus diversus]
MYESMTSGLLWVCVDINFDATLSESDNVKSLLESCAEKVLTDVCLLKDHTKTLPRPVYQALLEKALEKRRVLSIGELIRFYPEKKFVLPLPLPIKSHDLFIRPTKEVCDSLVNLKDNALVALSSYFKIIKKETINTNLHILDLNILPMHLNAVRRVCSFLLNDLKGHKVSSTYTIRMGCIIDGYEELMTLIKAKEAATETNVNFVIPSLLLSYERFFEDSLISLFEKMREDELCHFSLHFASVHPSLTRTCLMLKKFQNVRSLSLSYVPIQLAEEPGSLHALAETLNSLPNLQRIRLNGNNLSSCMHILFKNFCRNDFTYAKSEERVSDCCIVHRGKLQLLDVSSCELTSDDLSFLTELPLSTTLKSLDLSYNRLNLSWLSECMKAMSNNLVVLQVEKSIPKLSLLDENFPKLSAMKNIKYLNIRGLEAEELVLANFISDELRKMPDLQGIALSRPIGIVDCEHLEYLINLERTVKFLWA